MVAKNEFGDTPERIVYCLSFGCGRILSFREKLFGNKCLNCSMKGKIISSVPIPVKMEKDQVTKKVIKLISDNYHAPDEILLHHRLNEDIGLDSIDVVELTLLCENEFNVTVPNEKLSDITTVQNIVDAIAELKC